MKNTKVVFASCLLLGTLVLLLGTVFAEDTGKMVTTPSEKARVFITDSQSWETRGGGGGSSSGFGGGAAGGARPQTAEIIKTFGERCPDVTTNNIQAKANYIVVLDHEGGKSFLAHRNKVAVFTRVSGDSIVSKSTYSLGASVQVACEAIRADWTKNSENIKAAEAAETAAKERPVTAAAPTPAADPAATRVTVASTPVGADIEVDGNFVGNTPSVISLPAGDHTVTLSKNGYKTWERKMKSHGGDVNLNVQLDAQQEAAK